MWIIFLLYDSTKIANDGDIDKVVEPLELNRPCPASKKKLFLKSGLSLGKIELPKGWSYEPWKEDEKTVLLKLQSPEGIVYEGVENAIAHLLQQNCCPPGNIQRLRRRSFSASSCLQKEEPERFGWFLRCTDRMHFNIRPYCPDQVGQLEVCGFFCIIWFHNLHTYPSSKVKCVQKVGIHWLR